MVESTELPEEKKCGYLREMNQDSLCYQFELGKNHSLNITESNIRVLNNFILKSGFHHITALRVSSIFSELASDGLLTKDQFDFGVDQLFSSFHSKDERIECSLILSSIFYTFDRSDSGVVDVIDLICGLSILCEGSKSMKLALAFDLMDEDQDGLLTKRGLWRYFRAFLAALMTVAGASMNVNSVELISLCDDCAVWTAANLLESLRSVTGVKSNGCTFKDLADWYTKGGYQIATWLELLDLSKWLPLRPIRSHQSLAELQEEKDSSSENSSEDEDSEDGREKNPENPYVDEDGPEIFRSDLTGGSFLSLMESDSNFVLQISQLTGFYNLTPQQLIQQLQQFSSEETITIGEYNSFVSSAVPGNLTDEELEKVSYALSSIYYAYDDEGDNLAPTTALASGLTVFTKGSKSSKLSACFHLFDSDEDGYLSTEELEAFLGSYLRMLLGCSFSSSSQRGYGVTSQIVSQTCQFLAKEISNHYRDPVIDFQSFGDWYNEGGYKTIPWIELIDMSKWVKISAANAMSMFRMSGIVNTGVSSAVATAPAAQSSNGTRNRWLPSEDQDETANPTFTLILHKRNGQYVVSILSETVTAVLDLSSHSGLSKMDSETINQVILQSCNSEDLLLNRKEFDRFIHRIHPQRRRQYHADIMARVKRGEPPTSPFSEKNSDAFSSLFNVYDRTGKGVVDAMEIAVGLSVLCSGSKSVKLATAFDLLDEDRDGVLSRRGVWRFFRSFLCSLLTFSGTAQTLSAEEIMKIADSTALFACDSVIQSTATASGSEQKQQQTSDTTVGITFDHIADWYTTTGYRIAPWLELLDISKWNQLIAN